MDLKARLQDTLGKSLEKNSQDTIQTPNRPNLTYLSSYTLLSK